MATHDEGTVPEQPKPAARRKVSPARNAIGVVLLLAFSAVAFKEWDANRRSTAAIARLNEALAKDDGDLLSMEQVEGLIGRKPDGPAVPNPGGNPVGQELKVEYTWRGVFRKYPLVAIYTNRSRPSLIRTE